MRFLRQSLTGFFLLSLTLALLVMTGQTLREAVEDRMARQTRVPEGRERVFAVNVVTAEPQTVTPVLTAYGQVQSRRTLDIRAATGGTVLELAEAFVEGGSVTAGQMLARIDPADAQAALERAESDVLDAGAEARDAVRGLELARDELVAAEEQAVLRDRAAARQRDLAARGVGTDAAVETAELAASAARQAILTRRQAIAQAEARLEQSATRKARAEIALAEAQRRLDDTIIRAGFTGVLSEVRIVEGGLVSANEQLGRLIDGERLEVAFRISTSQYARLLNKEGRLATMPARIRLDVFGVDLERAGTLSRDSAAVAEGQSGRLIYADIEQPAGLKPGDFVTIEVDEPPVEQVVRLPGSAMDSSNTVLVLGANDRIEVLPVVLERRQGDDILVRGEGLEGREVVVERSPLLGAGIGVRALRGPGQEAGPEAAAEPDLMELTDERRARLLAFVESNQGMPAEARRRLLAQLQAEKVPVQVVQRLEQRIGG